MAADLKDSGLDLIQALEPVLAAGGLEDFLDVDPGTAHGMLVRLAEARHLLITTDESVERVGELAGYRDPTYFIRSFKRAHGMTPAVWRRTNR